MRYFLTICTLAIVLMGCQNLSPTSVTRVNGLYSGGMYDNTYGFIGGFAIDVSSRGTSVEGAACFAAITGDIACNTLNGSISGKDFDFTVGAISFNTVVSRNAVSGNYYTSDAGSGTIELARDTNAIQAVKILSGDQNTSAKVKQILGAFRR